MTAGAIFAVKTVPGWNEAAKSPGMLGLAFGLIFVAVIVQCAIFCCRDVARKVPMNYILLFIFTACESFILAVICAGYPTSVVL